jgi:predicted phosphodiesterase
MSTRNKRKCKNCARALCRGTKGEYCSGCFWDNQADRSVRIIEEEAKLAPSLPRRPKDAGSWIVISDLHIPYHDPVVITQAIRTAKILGIRNLCVGGDFIHGDTMSRFVNAGKQIPITDELSACARVFGALEPLFDKIIITMGNHDERVQNRVASWSKSSKGAQSMELLARVLDRPADGESIALGIFDHFFSSPKLTIHPHPDILINGTWLVTHPGSCSRVSPQTERKMAEKERKCVIGGHNHLFGVGFDASGTDVAVNIGHAADPSKWTYVRNRPTTFPTMVPGFCAIIQTEDCPGGMVIPLAVHPRWFNIPALYERFREHQNGEGD